MGRWSAVSSDDYYEAVEGRSTSDRPTTLHCVKCDQDVTVDADEPGPVWCERCRRRDDMAGPHTTTHRGAA